MWYQYYLTLPDCDIEEHVVNIVLPAAPFTNMD